MQSGVGSKGGRREEAAGEGNMANRIVSALFEEDSEAEALDYYESPQ